MEGKGKRKIQFIKGDRRRQTEKGGWGEELREEKRFDNIPRQVPISINKFHCQKEKEIPRERK